MSRVSAKACGVRRIPPEEATDSDADSEKEEVTPLPESEWSARPHLLGHRRAAIGTNDTSITQAPESN